MTQKEIMDRTRPKIAWQLGVDEKQVKRTARWHEDLGADAMDIMTLTMMVEGEFDITVDEQRLFDGSIYHSTIWDSIHYIQSALKRRGR